MDKINIDCLANLPQILSKVESSMEKEIRFENWEASVLAENPLNLSIAEDYALRLGKKILEKEKVSSEKPLAVIRDGKPFWQKKFFWLFSIVFLLVVTFGSSFLLFYFVPFAKLTVYPSKEVLSKTFTASLLQNPNEDEPAKGFLPVKKITAQEKNQKDFLTSGEKMVGTRARGQITIQNWTGADLTFDMGSLVKTEGGNLSSSLNLLLEKEAVVPRQTFSVPTPGQKLYQAGTVTVSVEAEDFGEAYNLAVGTTFTIADKPFSQVSAVAANNFTGGQSQKVRIFSKEDKIKSTAVLSKDLFEKGSADLRSKLFGDEILIEDSVNHKIILVNYNQELGVQADRVNLSLTTQSTGLAYSQSSLRKFILLESKDFVPSGMTFLDRENFLEIKKVNLSDANNPKVDILVKMILIPQMDLNNLKDKLLGKNLAFLQKEMQNLEGVEKYTYESWPNFLSKLKRLPFVRERFLVELRVE